MKKVFALIALAALLVGSTVVAFAWWDSLRADRDETFEIGYGVRLQVDSELQDTRALVPAGSFYAAYEADYTTAYVFEYVLSLEEPLTEGMTANLNVEITDFVLGTYTYGFNNVESVVTIDINGTTEADGAWVLENVFTDENNEVTVTVTLTLIAHPNAEFASHYAAVAGQLPTFSIGFEVENTSSSEAPESPLQ